MWKIFFLLAGILTALTSAARAQPAYYPAEYPYVLSQPIAVLPSGFLTIVAGDAIYYYNKGIFFQKDIIDQQYVVVPPPIGAVIYRIPQGYQLMIIRGIPYYEYGGVFYKRVLEGYQVINPPATTLIVP
jgi:hypothetical protein